MPCHVVAGRAVPCLPCLNVSRRSTPDLVPPCLPGLGEAGGTGPGDGGPAVPPCPDSPSAPSLPSAPAGPLAPREDSPRLVVRSLPCHLRLAWTDLAATCEAGPFLCVPARARRVEAIHTGPCPSLPALPRPSVSNATSPSPALPAVRAVRPLANPRPGSPAMSNLACAPLRSRVGRCLLRCRALASKPRKPGRDGRCLPRRRYAGLAVLPFRVGR